MFSITPEKYPSFGPAPHIQEATDSSPASFHCVVSKSHLIDIDSAVLQRTGMSITELSTNNPQEAYAQLGNLFKEKLAKMFIDKEDSNWEIGSPEWDGQHAFDGLTRYVEERRAPDPDIDPIDVTLSVWKRNGFLERIRGKQYSAEEILRFRLEPQDLTAC